MFRIRGVDFYMKEKYFILADSKKDAIETWNKSQYELTDFILAMTDNGIVEGAMIYEAFKTEGFLMLMNMFKFNFALAKKELGINGEYVERGGDVYKQDYNPKRNPKVLTLSKEEMQVKAKEVYAEITKQLQKLAEAMKKKVAGSRPPSICSSWSKAGPRRSP